MKYTKEKLEEAAKHSESVTGVMRYLGITYMSGNMRTYLKKRLLEFEIDISHFTGSNWNLGKHDAKRLTAKQIFVYDRRGGYKEVASTLRRALADVGVEYKCKKCGVGEEWQGEKLVIQIDHINGDFLDNRKKNLRFLCPNCHSQTETFGNKNKR